MTASLYERLGGTEGITKFTSDLVDFHLANKTIGSYFADKDVDKMKHGAATFVISGTGGPNVYEGKDMVATHKGMNISPEAFMAALDDTLLALEKNNIGQREQEEVLFILYSMRKEVMHK